MKKLCMVLSLALVAALCMVCLTACGYSGDPQKDKETLEGKGYTVTVIKTALEPNVDARLVATKGNYDDVIKSPADLLDEEKVAQLKSENVTIAYYKDADAAKAAYDKYTDDAKKSAKLSGKMIVAEGTVTGKDVIDIFKK